MQQLTRTTITIPQDLLRILKMKAVVENESVSSMITSFVEEKVRNRKTEKVKRDPIKSLGVFKLGIKQAYKNRDELYDATSYKTVYDIFLAATLIDNKIPRLLTANEKDFAGIKELTVVNPLK